MTTTDVEQRPALFNYCVEVWEEMRKEAIVATDADGSQEAVYIGALTKLIAGLGHSVPYYTGITRQLKRMGCIEQRKRGGGGQPSEWVLLAKPTASLWDKRSTIPRRAASKKETDLEQLKQIVRGHQQLIDALYEQTGSARP